MKKIIVVFTLALFATACNGSAEPVASESESEVINTETKLNDELFISLSAEILCLPDNNPEADSAEIEAMAKQIIARENVTEESFSAYQQAIESDLALRGELSLAIVGKMNDFCTVAVVDEAEESNSHDDETVSEATTEEKAEEVDAEMNESMHGDTETHSAE